MKFNIKSLLSLFLGAVMSVSFCVASVSAASSGKTFTWEPGETAEAGLSSPVSVEPVIMDFTSVAAMNRSQVGFYKHGDNVTEGRHKNIIDRGDDNSMQLIYTEHASFAPYRAMIKFNAPNVVTENHKYVRITYKTVDTEASQITLFANDGSGNAVLVPSTTESNGKWVTSAPAEISSVLPRLVKGMHCTLQYKSTNKNAEVYIKEIAFFGTMEDSFKHYGEEIDLTKLNYSMLTFGKAGNAAFLTGNNYGNYDNSGDDLKIMYAQSTNINGVNYMVKAKFSSPSDYSKNNIYTRVLYSAKNPDGVDSTELYYFNDSGQGPITLLSKNIHNTNGEYILSETGVLAKKMPERLANGQHGSIIPGVLVPGGEYHIKAIYFFPTREAADAFTVGGKTELTINGNPIENYKIVVSSDEEKHAMPAAGAIRDHIKALAGVTLEIVTDEKPESEYEILVGKSGREKSYKALEAAQAKEFEYARSIFKLDGNAVVIASELPTSLDAAVNTFLRTFLYQNAATAPETINLSSEIDRTGTVSSLSRYDWGETPNIASPMVLKDDFSVDNGYFTEENNADNWCYKNGVYTADADSDTLALSYIHVYEKDAKFSAKLKYTEAGGNGDAGVMLRYTAADAYVKAGYDFELGEWYIESREGIDFYKKRLASKKAEISKDVWYDLTFTVDEGSAVLTVNGQEMLSAADVDHLSNGRVAVYAQDASVSVDDVSVVLLSGQGTVFKDIIHTILPYDNYIEGGSAWEMKDGTLIYQHHSGTTFKSADNGQSWQNTSKWIDTSGYMNVLRLNNGDFIQTVLVGGNWISRTSSDDGKTWVNGGVICPSKMGGAGAGNMNDKLFQSATTGRIFYGQNFEAAASQAVDGRIVFCQFFYSDDNGKTWTKSDTDSWTIAGNEKTVYFGECKMLECADGAIRMYNSWSDIGYITYSESTDNGVTFGPLVKMTDFPTSRSSMQFVRDPYAENDTTYYMVWINCENVEGTFTTRTRLSIAYTTDGKNFEKLGDIWRWDAGYLSGGTMFIPQIVDPFVQVTSDYVIVGSGISEEIGSGTHNEQRQHIWSIKKSSLHAEKLGSFTDVTTADYYYDAVKFVTEKELFNGTSESTFEPFTTMTRAMFVTVLGRLDGADMSGYIKPTFADVLAGQWYTSYVEWAAANSIVNGIGNGLYGINNNVSVEQVCVMLARYNGNKSAANASGKTVADFTDSASVSGWAIDGVKWAVENGIYTGIGTMLNPGAPASRVLVSDMLKNYVTVYGE